MHVHMTLLHIHTCSYGPYLPYTYIHTYIHTYLYTDIHIYIHTDIHIYLYIMFARPSPLLHTHTHTHPISVTPHTTSRSLLTASRSLPTASRSLTHTQPQSFLILRMRTQHIVGARSHLEILRVLEPKFTDDIEQICLSYCGFRRIGGDG